MKRKFGETVSDEAVGNFDYQAGLSAIQRNPAKTRILIGDRWVWVVACEWETMGRRCRMAAAPGGFCPWHSDCMSGGDAKKYATDRAEFERWLKKTGRWEGEPDYLWGKVNGINDPMSAL